MNCGLGSCTSFWAAGPRHVQTCSPCCLVLRLLLHRIDLPHGKKGSPFTHTDSAPPTRSRSARLRGICTCLPWRWGTNDSSARVPTCSTCCLVLRKRFHSIDHLRPGMGSGLLSRSDNRDPLVPLHTHPAHRESVCPSCTCLLWRWGTTDSSARAQTCSTCCLVLHKRFHSIDRLLPDTGRGGRSRSDNRDPLVPLRIDSAPLSSRHLHLQGLLHLQEGKTHRLQGICTCLPWRWGTTDSSARDQICSTCCLVLRMRFHNIDHRLPDTGSGGRSRSDNRDPLVPLHTDPAHRGS